MSALIGIATLFVHTALMLAAAPVLTGCLRWLEARLVGRAGPSPLQPWRDLMRLARKHPVVALEASWLFRAAPAAAFAATLAAAALVPGFALGMASGPLADLLVIIGLLAGARAALALAALDAGTAFGGLGASRAVTFAVFAEPAMLMVIFALALLAGTTNLDAMAAALREGGPGLGVPLGLALLATVAIALAETGRHPLAGPATRIELAMVHQAMALEYSGFHLALVEWTAALRLLVWLTLIATLFVPAGQAAPSSGVLGWLLALPLWAAKIAVLATALGLVEAGTARMRLVRVPGLLGVALLLALLAAAFVFAGQGPA
jgi:formate hydrogenlyase subunit 4